MPKENIATTVEHIGLELTEIINEAAIDHPKSLAELSLFDSPNPYVYLRTGNGEYFRLTIEKLDKSPDVNWEG